MHNIAFTLTKYSYILRNGEVSEIQHNATIPKILFHPLLGHFGAHRILEQDTCHPSIWGPSQSTVFVSVFPLPFKTAMYYWRLAQSDPFTGRHHESVGWKGNSKRSFTLSDWQSPNAELHHTSMSVSKTPSTSHSTVFFLSTHFLFLLFVIGMHLNSPFTYWLSQYQKQQGYDWWIYLFI